jgi:hypothetical protein
MPYYTRGVAVRRAETYVRYKTPISGIVVSAPPPATIFYAASLLSFLMSYGSLAALPRCAFAIPWTILHLWQGTPLKRVALVTHVQAALLQGITAILVIVSTEAATAAAQAG